MPKQLFMVIDNKMHVGELPVDMDERVLDLDGWLRCTHQGCGTTYARTLHRGGCPTEHLEYYCIYDAILDTRLFCMAHAQMHTESLCRNARISVPSK